MAATFSPQGGVVDDGDEAVYDGRALAQRPSARRKPPAVQGGVREGTYTLKVPLLDAHSEDFFVSVQDVLDEVIPAQTNDNRAIC